MTATKIAAGEAARIHEQFTAAETLVPVADIESIGLGVGRRTIGRRIKNPPPGFPVAFRVNGRLNMKRSEVERYKAQMIAEALAAQAAVKRGLGVDAGAART